MQALGCDAYVASPHKWLMAPKGTGFLYIRRGRAGPLLDDAGERRVERPRRRARSGSCSTAPAASRPWRACTRHCSSSARLEVARIERWDAALTTRLRDGLARNSPAARLSSPADPRFAAAITTFRIEGVPAKKLQDALWARKVRVRAQNDARGVRLSAHLYVSPADIDRVLAVAAAVR